MGGWVGGILLGIATISLEQLQVSSVIMGWRGGGEILFNSISNQINKIK